MVGGAKSRATSRGTTNKAPKLGGPSYVLGVGPGVAMLVGSGFKIPGAAYRTALVAVGRDGPLRVSSHVHHGEDLTRVAFLKAGARRALDTLDTTVALLFVDWRTRAGRTLGAFDRRLAEGASERLRDVPFPIPTAANMATTIARWFEAIGACDAEGPSHARLGDFIGEMSQHCAHGGASRLFVGNRPSVFGERSAETDLDSVGLGLAPIASWARALRHLREARTSSRRNAASSPQRSPQLASGKFVKSWLGVPHGVTSGDGEVVGLFGM
jgi:hypothetical protein